MNFKGTILYIMNFKGTILYIFYVKSTYFQVFLRSVGNKILLNFAAYTIYYLLIVRYFTQCPSCITRSSTKYTHLVAEITNTTNNGYNFTAFLSVFELNNTLSTIYGKIILVDLNKIIP